jgi:hypothetical protein
VTTSAGRVKSPCDEQVRLARFLARGDDHGGGRLRALLLRGGDGRVARGGLEVVLAEDREGRGGLLFGSLVPRGGERSALGFLQALQERKLQLRLPRLRFSVAPAR